MNILKINNLIKLNIKLDKKKIIHISSSYNNADKSCYINHFYLEKNLRGSGIGKDIFKINEKIIIKNYPSIQSFKLNALNYNKSNKLVNYYINLGYTYDLFHDYDSNILDNEIVPMIKKL